MRLMQAETPKAQTLPPAESQNSFQPSKAESEVDAGSNGNGKKKYYACLYLSDGELEKLERMVEKKHFNYHEVLGAKMESFSDYMMAKGKQDAYQSHYYELKRILKEDGVI